MNPDELFKAGVPVPTGEASPSGAGPVEGAPDCYAGMPGVEPATPPALIAAIRPVSLDVLSRDYRPPPRRFLLSREPGPGDGAGWVGVLPAGKVGMLAGAGGEGKSRIALQLAVAVATGRRFLARVEQGPDRRSRDVGGWIPTTTGRVLLLCGEEDRNELDARVYETIRAVDLDDAERARLARRLHLAPLAGVSGTQLTTDRGEVSPLAGALSGHLAQLARDGLDDGLDDGAGPGTDRRGFALVILDPLSRFAGGGVEVDNALATRFIAAAEALTQGPGNPAVLIVHHTSQGARQSGSADATAARGVTGLTDGARFMLSLSTVRALPRGGESEPVRLPCGAALRLRVAKVNNAAPAPDLALIRGAGGFIREASPEEAARIEAARTPAPRGKGTPTTTASTSTTAPTPSTATSTTTASTTASTTTASTPRAKDGDDDDRV